MENNHSYFNGIIRGVKSLAIGLGVTFKEYVTPKSTEQYPENRKTTLHVSKRHRGRLVFKRDENGNHKCVACTMCERACPNGTIKIGFFQKFKNFPYITRGLSHYVYTKVSKIFFF